MHWAKWFVNTRLLQPTDVRNFMVWSAPRNATWNIYWSFWTVIFWSNWFLGKTGYRKIYKVTKKRSQKFVSKGTLGHVNFIVSRFKATEIKRTNLASSQPVPHLTCQIQFSTSIKYYSNKPWDQQEELLTLSFSKWQALPSALDQEQNQPTKHCGSAHCLSGALHCHTEWETSPKRFLNFKIWECSWIQFLVPEDLGKYTSWSNWLSPPYLISNTAYTGLSRWPVSSPHSFFALPHQRVRAGSEATLWCEHFPLKDELRPLKRDRIPVQTTSCKMVKSMGLQLGPTQLTVSAYVKARTAEHVHFHT